MSPGSNEKRTPAGSPLLPES